MQFNFPLFQGFAAKAYHNVGSLYPIEDVLNVFKWYFSYYEHYMKRPHPPIKVEQIERIITAMPSFDVFGGELVDIDPDAYEALIAKHFQTKYNDGYGGCDYNINHFFSGDIRLMRFYEECYRGE